MLQLDMKLTFENAKTMKLKLKYVIDRSLTTLRRIIPDAGCSKSNEIVKEMQSLTQWEFFLNIKATKVELVI